QTVAGKTGTCIGQGAWLGLFTSYAPVVNPKLAVVVITRGTDAHNHLPAAGAGDIYRSLSPRFGTNTDFQVPQTSDGETPTKDKKAAALDEEAQETKAATEAEQKAVEEKAEQAAAEAGASDATADTPATKVTAKPDIKSKVKATVMPIENKAKPASQPA